jgi:hypothetical protein
MKLKPARECHSPIAAFLRMGRVKWHYRLLPRDAVWAIARSLGGCGISLSFVRVVDNTDGSVHRWM